MNEFSVISHTHWDREWFLPYEIIRLKLVDLIDSLLEIIAVDSDYIFHLDAQTIIIEDYLEIRPQKRVLLKKLIKNGNILIGPWYLQNDFYLTSGEATIRNLLEGKKLSEEFGGYNRYGYAPDQFGNISQLPQILNNFGIDTFIFGRGYNEYFKNADGNPQKKIKPCEFLWKGADDSILTSVFLAYWYNNAQRFPENIENIKVLLELSNEQFEKINITPYVLMMNGVDHLEPQVDLLKNIDLANKYTNYKVKQESIPIYLKKVKDYVNKNKIDLNVFSGELNKGDDYELLKGCWSSRIYLKSDNEKSQNKLENCLEPLYSMLEFTGFKDSYPFDQMSYLWKQLLKNHPHDNICGCSTDAVHDHMEDSFKKINEIADELIDRGLNLAANHIFIDGQQESDFKILIVNTLENETNSVIKVEIEIPISENIKGIKILDKNGNNIDFCVIDKFKRQKDIFSPLNLPGIIDVKVFSVIIYLKNIKPYSFNSFLVRPYKKQIEVVKNNIINNSNFAEIKNEYLKLNVNKNGIVLIDIKNKQLFENFITIEDCADRGDVYVFVDSPDKALYFNKPICFSIIEDNDFIKTVQVEYDLLIPENYDFKNLRRSKKVVVNKLKINFTIKKSCEILEISYELINKSKDHRLRILFDSKIVSKFTYSDIPFDIVQREKSQLYYDTKANVHFNTSFVALENNMEGVAILTEGNYEYENLENGKLAFTIVRSTGSINRNSDFEVNGGKHWIVEGNQCIRTLKSRFGVTFYRGLLNRKDIYVKAKRFKTPLLCYCTSCDFKKFSGGRVAVQDTRLTKIYYKKDKYENISLNNDNSIIEIKGDNIIVTALKKSEDKKNIILRLLNLSDNLEKLVINCKANIYETNAEEVIEGAVYHNNYTNELNKKKLLTLKIKD